MELASQPVELFTGEQSSPGQQTALGDRLEGGDVGVGLVVASEPGVCGERHMSLVWPGVPVTGMTATWPSREFSALMLSTTTGCIPKSSKSTSHTSPRNGSGSAIGLAAGRGPDTDRQRRLAVAVEVGDAPGHPLFSRTTVQQVQRSPDDLGGPVQSELFRVTAQLPSEVVADPPARSHKHLWSPSIYAPPCKAPCKAAWQVI